jgi:hypothetical protein
MGWIIFTVLCVVLVMITIRNVQEGFHGQRGTGGGVRYGGVSEGVRHGGGHGGGHGGYRGGRGWTTVGSGGGSSWGWWPFEWWPWYGESIILID